MNIEEVKSQLENQIIFWDGVIGVGIISEDNVQLIEIAIERKDTTISDRINKLIDNNHWHGYRIRIVFADGFKFHDK